MSVTPPQISVTEQLASPAKSRSRSSRAVTPRALTAKQIQDIIDSLDLVPGKGLSARKAAHEDAMYLLRTKLSGVKLAPSMYDRFAQTIYKDWVNGTVVPFTPVGLSTSLAYSAPMTQSTLNSFHAAGASSGLAGTQGEARDTFTAIKEDHAQRIMLTPQSRIAADTPAYDMHSNKHLSDTRAVYAEYRGIVEETTMSHVISTFRFITGADPEFREMYAEFQTKMPPRAETPVMSTIIRIELDTARMFSHKILIGDIIEKLEPHRRAYGVTFVWGPTWRGLLYVLATRVHTALGALTGADSSDEVDQLNKFASDMSSKPDFAHIKGIPSITTMRADTAMLRSVVREYVTDAEDPLVRRIYINTTKTRESAVSMQDIAWVIKYSRVAPEGVTAAEMKAAQFAIVTAQTLAGLDPEKFVHEV